MKFLVVLFFAFWSFLAFCQVDFSIIEQKKLEGDFEAAQSKVEFYLQQKNTTLHQKIQLFQTNGDLAMLSGDFDFAFENWKKAAQLRLKIYPNKKDYHHALTYASFSNYYYEKYDKILANKYADSCSRLLNGLTLNQQLEVEVFKIWNILGQSYKQSASASDYQNFSKIYAKTIDFYKKSVDFIVKNKLNKHYLAKSLHLLGNAYFDWTYAEFEAGNKEKVDFTQKKAIAYYDQAISLWRQLYGNHHYELGRTYFIKALLFSSLPIATPQLRQEALLNFRLSMKAYGYENSNKESMNFEKVPNKVDLLMMLKYYTTCLLEFQSINPHNNDYLNEAIAVNKAANTVWNRIHTNFKGKSINKNLAIYSLIPQGEEITIVMRQQLSEHEKMKRFFEANQKLKYYDLYKKKNGASSSSISAIQAKLKNNQVLLDFHFNQIDNVFYVLFIHKHKVRLEKMASQLDSTVMHLKTAIVEHDFTSYTQNARKLYKAIFSKPLTETELIICPVAQFNNLPFEVLLSSDKGINTNDYRKLDYLLHQKSIRYVLTPGSLSNQPIKVNGDIDVFCPQFNNQQFANLPFSTAFGEKMQQEVAGTHVFFNENATQQAFFNSKHAVAHISSHAVIGEEPGLNYMLLSDGKLMQSELNQLVNIPRLMVLNTCNSGNGKHFLQDGVDGFVREFHLAGVSSTISNLWEVDDKTSNELFFRFYKRMKADSNSIMALQAAKISQVKNAPVSELAAPYYWAGHRLIGDAIVFKKMLPLDSNQVIVFWLLPLPLVILVLVWFRRKKKFKN